MPENPEPERMADIPVPRPESDARLEPEPERTRDVPFYKENPFWGAVGGFTTFFLGGMGFEMSGYPTVGIIFFWFALPWALMATWLAAKGLIKNKRIRILSAVISVLVVAVLMWLTMYVLKPPAAVFHITTIEVAFNRQNENQLIANVYFQNDAGDAAFTSYSTDTLSVGPTIEGDAEYLGTRWKALDEAMKKGDAPEILVPSKEARWVTNFGPVFSKDQLVLFKDGKARFYFMGLIVAREGTVAKVVRYCGAVTGLGLNSVVDCAPTSTKARH